MNALGHLWDDTFAGPFPESGLRKLHVFSSQTSSSSSTAAAFHSRAEPSSPASAPCSPLTPTSPAEEGGRTTARKAAAPEQPRYPTAFDWVVISALDR